ncbi:MAG: hypothetical protein H6R04_40 [Burkholderiaceae bacterium]|nr:hypothetical protein [Burkholderiaceae bacterium]
MRIRIKSALVPLCAALLLLPMAGVQAKQGGKSGQVGAQSNSAKQYAPGQQKKTATGTSKSAKEYAPGQRKKSGTQSGKSAKQYAPGQQKKNQVNQ